VTWAAGLSIPTCPQSYPQSLWIAQKELMKRALTDVSQVLLEVCRHRSNEMFHFVSVMKLNDGLTKTVQRLHKEAQKRTYAHEGPCHRLEK
jgi:hypothetical protein